MQQRFTHLIDIIVTHRARIREVTVSKYDCLKIPDNMALAAIPLSRQVTVVLTLGHDAVMASRAGAGGNPRMIKTPVDLELKKRIGVVAVVAFDEGDDMRSGFANGHATIMATATRTEDLQVVHKTDSGKTESRMTSLARIAASKMIR